MVKPTSNFFQRVCDYEERYNKLLARQLVSHPDAKTKKLLSQAQAELQNLEKANPIFDAQHMAQLAPAYFLLVEGEDTLKLPNDLALLHCEERILTMNRVLLRNAAERQRFKRVVQNYVIPYNKTLYLSLKKKRQARVS